MRSFTWIWAIAVVGLNTASANDCDPNELLEPIQIVSRPDGSVHIAPVPPETKIPTPPKAEKPQVLPGATVFIPPKTATVPKVGEPVIDWAPPPILGPKPPLASTQTIPPKSVPPQPKPQPKKPFAPTLRRQIGKLAHKPENQPPKAQPKPKAEPKKPTPPPIPKDAADPITPDQIVEIQAEPLDVAPQKPEPPIKVRGRSKQPEEEYPEITDDQVVAVESLTGVRLLRPTSPEPVEDRYLEIFARLKEAQYEGHRVEFVVRTEEFGLPRFYSGTIEELIVNPNGVPHVILVSDRFTRAIPGIAMRLEGRRFYISLADVDDDKIGIYPKFE